MQWLIELHLIFIFVSMATLEGKISFCTQRLTAFITGAISSAISLYRLQVVDANYRVIKWWWLLRCFEGQQHKIAHTRYTVVCISIRPYNKQSVTNESLTRKGIRNCLKCKRKLWQRRQKTCLRVSTRVNCTKPCEEMPILFVSACVAI